MKKEGLKEFSDFMLPYEVTKAEIAPIGYTSGDKEVAILLVNAKFNGIEEFPDGEELIPVASSFVAILKQPEIYEELTIITQILNEKIDTAKVYSFSILEFIDPPKNK